MHFFLFFLVFFLYDMVIPEGHRFRPTPEELVNYLMEKLRYPAFTTPDIKDVDIYKYHPSDLPGLFSPYQSDDQVSYFFCTLKNKYGKSDRASRTAIGGSWKKTGKDHQVDARDSNKPIGIKKIFVFYKDRDFRKENRTNWVMHEYSEIQEDHNSNKQVESQQPRNLHLPSSSDYDVADSNLMEVEPNLQPNLNIPHVTKNISPEVIKNISIVHFPISITWYIWFKENVYLELMLFCLLFVLWVRPLDPALWDELIDWFIPQSPIHPQPGSSHSSCFSNGSNVWTPQSASEQEDDLANSRPMKVKSDQLQPNQHISYVTTNGFPESESQLVPKRHKSSNGEDLVAKNISSEPLPEPEDIFSGLESLSSGKQDAIDGLQSPISSVFGDDSIVWNTLLGSELEDNFLNLEWELPDNFLREETPLSSS